MLSLNFHKIDYNYLRLSSEEINQLLQKKNEFTLQGEERKRNVFYQIEPTYQEKEDLEELTNRILSEKIAIPQWWTPNVYN